MLNLNVFDTAVFLALISIVVLLGRKKLKDTFKFKVSTGLTILAYRALTFTFLVLGGTFPENAFVNNRFDHKWLGLTIIILTLLFWPKNKAKNYRPVFLGLGTGMLIDETSEILSLLGVNFAPAFRDSLPDLFLVIGTFVIFLVVISIACHSEKSFPRGRIRV